LEKVGGQVEGGLANILDLRILVCGEEALGVFKE
jgi:hypothetical protein